MNNNRSALYQQHRIQHYAATSDVFSFFNQLTSPDLLDMLESSLPEHRERLFRKRLTDTPVSARNSMLAV